MPPWAAWTALVVLWIAGGSNFIALKAASDGLPALALSALRLGAAALLLAPVAAWRMRRPERRPTAAQVRDAALGGLLLLLLLLGIGQTLLVVSLTVLPAGTAAVLGSSSPLFLALFAWGVLRRPLSRRQVVGILVGFGGLALMAGGSAVEELNVAGALAVLLSAAAWAAGSLYLSHADEPADPIVSLFVQMLAAAAAVAMVALWTGELGRVDLAKAPWSVLAGLAYAVVFGLFSWLNQATTSALANTFTYVAPVVALALGTWLLGEPVSWIDGVAAAVALLGVYLMLSAAPVVRPSPS